MNYNIIMNKKKYLKNYFEYSLSDIKRELRKNQIMNEIKNLNNLDDYLRLKNYNLIIYKIRLLKSYI